MVKHLAFKTVGRFSGHRAMLRYEFQVRLFLRHAGVAPELLCARPGGWKGPWGSCRRFVYLWWANGSHRCITPPRIVTLYMFGSLLPLHVLGQIPDNSHSR